MILRKPYAFLVKHFRLIHIVLLLLMAYVAYSLYNVLDFYNGYIAMSLTTNDYAYIASHFLGFFSVMAILLTNFISGVMLYLLKYKHKPIVLYGALIAIYSITFGLMLFSVVFVGNFQFSPPTPVTIRIVRDIVGITFVAQLLFIAIVFVRAIGFDVKKFDFKKDVQDLGITDEDNEEFEFEINLDTQDIITKIKKRIRYFMYYYRENIVVFYAVYAVIIIMAISSLVSFFTSLEHVYKEGEQYQVGGVVYKVTKSYRTLNNSKGNRINDKYFYVITKLRVKNVSDRGTTLNTDNMKLFYDNVYSTGPNNKVYGNFKEYGTQYYNQVINPGEERDFIVIYEAPIEFYSRRLSLRTLYNAYYDKSGAVQYSYRTVRLEAELDEEKIVTIDTKHLGEEMSFKGSILGDTTITIKDFKLSDTFYYNITNCTEDLCRSAKADISASTKQNVSLTVMRLNYDLKFDTDTIGANYNVNDFIARFGRIRYVINGIKDNQSMNHNLVLKDLTPLYTNKISFIEVKNILNRADIIYLDFRIRDKVYTYVLKDELKDSE